MDAQVIGREGENGLGALKTVEISGYRGFGPKQVVHLGQPTGIAGSGLTLITGSNNSGKSTIIEALRARAGHQSPTFSEGTRNKEADFVRFSYEFENRMEVIESLRPGSSQAKVLGKSAGDKIMVLPSRRGFSAYFGRAVGNRDSYIDGTPLPARRLQELSSFEMRLFEIEGNPQVFNELLGELLGYAPTWSIDQSAEGSYYVRIRNGKSSHSTDGAGEGIVSLFSIVDALTSSGPGAILAIDEPELSLHPAILRRLSGVFLRFSADRQIVIATHSPYFVDPRAISNGAALVRVVSTLGESEVFQLSEEGREALRKMHNPDKPNLKAPHTFGLDAKELFFQDDRIVLTEGQDDVMLYPEVVSQLPIGRMPGHLFGWGVGGADNMSHVCRVLSDLGYKRVAALLDNDQLDKLDALRSAYPAYKFYVIPAKDVRDKGVVDAKPAVEGLLEGGKTLRVQYQAALQSIFQEIDTHFTPAL